MLGILVPMLGSLGSIVLVATVGSSTPGGQGRSFLAAGMFLFATFGFLVVQLDRQRRQRTQAVTGTRREYLRYLATVRTIARDAAVQQRAALLWQHPDPRALAALAEERSRVWERLVTDPHFLHVRYGVCSRPLSLELVPPDSAPIDQVDPAAASALHRLLAVHRMQPSLPAVVDLPAFDRIEVCGPEWRARALARAIICSAATFHSPEHLAIAVLSSEQALAEWDWVKWLPHALSGQDSDAVGPRRMVSTSLAELAPLLPSHPHALVVVDDAEPPPGHQGMTVLHLPSRWDELADRSRLRLLFADDGEVDDDGPRISALRLREPPVRAAADQCDLATAEAVARRLTPLHAVPAGVEAEPTSAGEVIGPSDLMDLLGLGDVHRYDASSAWRTRPAGDRLRVPIGRGEGGEVVHLDLKESAQLGMGPHGLVIGATGSGKSEFLRTLVLGLALTHSPEQLNMVLVDFKGGATFAGMSAMPHVSAVITNLADELALVDRMQDALSGEMVRRQEVLRDAGNVASVRDYERARRSGEQLAPLPSLFIVVDEFSEMLSAKPEFIDLFVAIGRLGRSLGLHLLLASQRLEEGRLRGLESHLSYRVGLRTFSAQESRTVLGVPDAYELPPIPGLGFLKPDQSTLLRFKAAYVSGPAASARHQTVTHDESGVLQGILPWTIGEVRLPAVLEPVLAQPAPEHEASEQESLLDVAVGRMKGFGPQAHEVWLPPLDVPDTLDGLMSDLATDPEMGLVSREWRALGGLTVPLGTVDRPRQQRCDTLTVSLAGASGHVAVVGGPRTGKSTLLRTLVTSLSLTTTPAESQFFVLDFGGGTFAPLRSLPHMAGIGTRSEPDVVRRIVAEVTGIVDRREAYFRAHGIDSIETYRSRRVLGRADDGYGDVFLVVDGWSTLRADFDDLELELQRLASRGLTFGFHVVTASSRWADFRAAVRDSARHAARAAARRPDGLRGRPSARRPGAAVPAGTRDRARETALPGRPPAHRRRPGRRHAGRRGRASGQADQRGLDRPPGPEASAAARADRGRGPVVPGRRVHPRERAAPAGRQREGARAGRPRPGRRAALADLRRRQVRQERRPAQLPARSHAHADAVGGPARRGRLPALAVGRGA